LISATALFLLVTPSVADKPADKEHDKLMRRVPKYGKDLPAGHVHEMKIDGNGQLQTGKTQHAKTQHAKKEHTEAHGAKPEVEAKHMVKETKDTPRMDHEKFKFDDEDENDVALDELEAMTIESAMLKKHPIPRRRRQNCKWTEWVLDGRCSQTCGGGMQPRKRSQSPGAAHGGSPCPGKDN